ncbi:LacI family DNA-binding transcriptional regulator [Staphylococcus borealis]|uniref:LacI family DNA-binding transcriptional regulator n=1 Tax=Staphylococcus borealis TaxID=2742203 RepID=UPI0039EA85CF
MKDVAKEANVATSTVSRVIQNNPKISDSTTIKVKTAMAKLGYIPNQAARTLITNKTLTIGLIQKSSAPEIRQNPFNSDVLNGINQACNRRGYSTRMTVSEKSADLYEEVKTMIQSKSVDGFILLYSLQDDPIERLLHEFNVPYLIIGKSLNYDQVIHIDNDNVDAAYQLAKYLYQLGHRSMLFLQESGHYAVTEDRTEGFKQYCNDVNIPINYVVIASIKELRNCIKHSCIDVRHKPTVIITSDAMLNMQLLNVLYEYQIRIPDDIQTATFNTSFLTENATPSQTSVNINPDILGLTAGNTIIDLLGNKAISFTAKMISTQIVERVSTTKR